MIEVAEAEAALYLAKRDVRRRTRPELEAAPGARQESIEDGDEGTTA